MEAIIIIGCPGSGKTTMALEGFPDHEIIERDIIRKEISGSLKAFHASDDKTKENRVTMIRDNVISLLAIKGKSIVVSDTNISKYSRRNLVRQLRSYGYRIEYRPRIVPLDELLKRNNMRPFDDTVPPEVIIRMFESLSAQMIDGTIAKEMMEISK